MASTTHDAVPLPALDTSGKISITTIEAQWLHSEPPPACTLKLHA